MSVNVVNKTTGELTRIAGSPVNTNFVGTREEWNELPTAEKIKYETCSITDDLGDGFQYSTTEQKTGKKWIDGKDIYCRVISGTTGTTGVDNSVAVIQNFGNLISISGSLIQTGAIVPFTFARIDAQAVSAQNNWWVSACIQRSDNGVNVRYAPEYYSNMPYYLILEYTKTE